MAVAVLLINGSLHANEPPPDVGLVTKLSGEVTYSNEAEKGPPAKALAFMKIRQGDMLALSPGAKVTLIYFSNGRQETWDGPVSFKVGKENSQTTGAHGLEGKPQVQVVPSIIAGKIGNIEVPLPRDRTSRSGHTKIRGDSAGKEPSAPVVPRVLDNVGQAQIKEAKKKYVSLKKDLGSESVTPELFLLSVFTEYEQYEEMEHIIEMMLKKQPDNAALKDLAVWIKNGSQESPGGSGKYALLIGISDYENTKFESLDGPLNDLELVRKILIERFGFKEENILKLSNIQASHTALEAAFASLGRRINPGDFVYIHYSGHGSFTKDFNGDELSGKDQTWVSFGSRPKTETRQGLDNFDVLDDELNEWLIPIHEKVGQLVFVSDSCHSASVTRGSAPKVRAAPFDNRNHPLGKNNFKKVKLTKGVRIGAARDVESASEFQSEDGKSYGLFTWYWAQALMEAHPQESWNDVFKRVYSLVTSRKGILQHPQLEGEANRLVFGGNFSAPSKSIPVTMIQDEGNSVHMKAGLLSGITKGSTYRLYSPLKPGKEPALLEITRVYPTYSIGKVIKGEFHPGYLVVEETHIYPFEPVKVFLNADFPDAEDKGLLMKISKTVQNLPQYELTDDQKKCDIVLYVLRPKTENNRLVFHTPTDTLPQSFPSQPPEVWVLSPVEHMLQGNLKIKFEDQERGNAILQENLGILARVKEVKNLSTSRGSGVNPIRIMTTLLVPDEACGNGPDCIELPNNLGLHRKEGPLTLEQVNERRLKRGVILTFALKNVSGQDYYCYLLDLSPNGKIEAIFPHTGSSAESALIKSGNERDLSTEVGLRLDDPGLETVKLIVTQKPIDISLLEQGEFIRRGEERKVLNPLERLLCNAMHGKRGLVALRNDDWGTLQFEVVVEH